MRRVSAFFIDCGFLLFLFQGLVYFNLELSLFSKILLGWGYYSIFDSSSLQATVGKRLCGLMVTGENGKRISLARAVVRNYFKVFVFTTLGLGFAIPLFFKHQTLHDRLSGCLILKNSTKGWISSNHH